MLTKSFKGVNVFLSRNLVPPEIFDALHDALKQNGAELFLCCDPSRSGPNDYHIISSPEHEKFEDLRAKGCNLLGPQCVLFCAKEHRVFPKRGFTCCLAMDGVKVLASGFEKDEKVKMEQLVTAMGGLLHPRASPDINFVIVKNVLAAKYKWALNVLKKPIVTINWLYQCWKEHRVVPQESYRVLPFSGLTICATRIPADERKEMEMLIMQNGGKYSADLTKNCTHLVSDIPEGDKYKVARKWGHIQIVTRKWFHQSINRRACLNEEFYPVQRGPSTNNPSGLKGKHSQDKGNIYSQSDPSSLKADSTADSNSQVPAYFMVADPNLETTPSQNISSNISDTPVSRKEGNEPPNLQPENEIKFANCVADDSQTEDNDLYLSDCRILFVGFQASEMRKLLNMVRRGGGSRYMAFSEKLTHIIVGTPSEDEKKEIRRHAALGVIYVVRIIWLEDCDREKREIPVLHRHIASDVLLPKDPTTYSNKTAAMEMPSVQQGNSNTTSSSIPVSRLAGAMNSQFGMPLEKQREEKHEDIPNGDSFLEVATKSIRQTIFHSVDNTLKGSQKLQDHSDVDDAQHTRSSKIFKGKLFRFSSSFPEDRRAEIVEWVNQGGGEFMDDPVKRNVDFIIDSHGQKHRPVTVSQTTIISSHWIRSCLEDGCILDVAGHILYSPLPCRIPLPGFEGFQFCVSQYEEKDRLLLRNLCFVLGAKFKEKLTKKATHLICKYNSGPKYEAACKWGICSVTSEWIFECVRQDTVVSVDPFCPRDVTLQDREGGLCTVSQNPTQAARMLSGESQSQCPSQSQDLTRMRTRISGKKSDSVVEEAKCASVSSKRARLLEDSNNRHVISSEMNQDVSICQMDSMRNSMSGDIGEVSHNLPDVAAAIEDLLEQTNKIQDFKSPGRTECDQSIFSPDRSILGKDRVDSCSAFGISKQWLNRTEKQDEHCSPSVKDVNAYDGFSETQTDSQVVGYEEDLSGRQMIIDRVRTRSSMT